MDPTRSTRSSPRRSSILKPAKPRQPLQNLNFNSSSNESSPTIKLKRRVSFAEKKHVKEFCNSLEQGTVWDNTYEEHDISNLKPLCAPDGKEREVENVREGRNVEFNESCNQLVYPDPETIKKPSIQGNNVQFAADQSIQSDLDGEYSDLDFTCDSVSPTDLQSSSCIHPTISVYQDPCTDVPNETSEPARPNVHDLSCSNLNATSYQDINMDFTEIVCNADIRGNESEGTVKNSSIEFTQPVPTSMDIVFNSQYSAKKLNRTATEEMDRDMSMEPTVAIPSVLKSAINNDDAEVAAYSTDDRTVRFNNVSMEVTSAVPTILCNAQQRNINEVENWELNLRASDGDCRSIIFHDTSMEMTKPVKISSRKEAPFPDNARRLSTIQKVAQSKYDITCVDEETMEMTKPMKISGRKEAPFPDNACRLSTIQKVAQSKYDITCVDEETMEMTKPVKISSRKEAPCPDNACRLSTIQKVAQSKYDITCVDEETMEMTKPVKISSRKEAPCSDNARRLSTIQKVAQSKYDITCVDEKTMEMTKPVKISSRKEAPCPDNARRLSTIQKVPQSKYDITCVDEETMEMTKPVKISSRKEAPFPDNACRLSTIQKVPQSKYDITCVDEETMEMTKPVKISSRKEAPFPDNARRLSTIQKVPQSKYDITCVDEETMEMTKPMKISGRKEAPCSDNARRLSTIQKIPQSKYDITCVDEETMEVTKAVAVNIHSVPRNQGINAMHCEATAVDSNSGELRGGANSYETMVNFDETTVCDDEAMDFTTAVGTFFKERTDNFQNDEPAKIVFYPQWSSHNSIPDNLRDDANSDRTRVFHDNSMTTTAVVSSLYVSDTCEEEEEIDRESEINDQESGRTVLLPNISMEITEAVTALRNRVEMENFVDLTKVGESPLFENTRSSHLSREPLDHSAVPDNVLRDITAIVVPSANADMPSNEMICNADNPRKLKDSCTKEPTLNEVQNSVNTRTSMALHSLIEQDTCASALEENNTPAACAPFNTASNGDIRAATSQVIQTESLRHESSRVIATHSRRTYTLKSFGTGHSFTSSDKENEFSGMNVDTSCYKTNDRELQDNERYREQSSMEKSIAVFGNDLEELESIKPPSFMCLDDSLCEDTPVNVSYHQEVNRETDCLADTVKRSENIECEGSPKFTFDYLKCNLVQSDQVNILEEDGCNSQTFLNKHTLLESEPDSSKLGIEDQGPENYTNADVQVLECSSSTVNDIERFPVPEIAKDLEDMEMKDIAADNSNVEAQRMDCSSEIKNTGEGARDDQNISNAMATESRESLEPHVLPVENNISIELDPFSKLTEELKIRAQSDEIIWDVYHENIEKRVFVIGFISCSLLVAIYLRDDCDAASVQFIKDIRIISRLADDADVSISIVHWLILEKLDAARLMDLYKTSEDILPILDYISKEAKLAMDFMFDLKRLEDLNLMEITRDSISFVSRTKRMDIILRVTINIRPFDKIESQDISVHCLLGSVREDDIKKLITKIKRDHKFLRRFVNDVREYIYLMEEASV